MTTRLLKSSENINGLPIGFQEVEYLESTGTQYIDTGYIPTPTSTYKSTFQLTSITTTSGNWFCVFGSVESNNSTFTELFLPRASGGGDVNQILAGNHNSSYMRVNYPWAVNTKYSFEMTPTAVSVNEVSQGSISVDSSFTCSHSIYLFARHEHNDTVGYNVSAKIHSFTIYEGNTLVRDFIPALNPAGRPCMYDLVGKKAYYNLGTGEFTYGRKIIPVEYIANTGSSYINTGYNPNSTTRVEAKFKMNESPTSFKWLFLSRAENVAGGGFGFGCVANGYIASEFNNRQTSTDKLIADNYYIIDKNKNLCTYNDKTLTNVNSTFSVNYPLPIFALNNVGTIQAGVFPLANCYYFRIYDNDILVQDFIPAIDENNVPFMFDKVTHTIYDNAGTGTFNYGKKLYNSKVRLYKDSGVRFGDVLPKGLKRVEYLENTGVTSARNWISTGIVPDTTTRWEVRLSFNNTSTGKLMGSGYAAPTRFNIGIESSRFRFAFNTWFDANTNIITPDTNPHTWVMDAPSKTFTIDGYSITTTQTFGASTFPICLFGRGNSASGLTETSNAVIGKIYYSKIWQNDVLVSDMVPVLDNDGIPCMYDKVSGELFYNQGSGQFTYGNIIPDKVRLSQSTEIRFPVGYTEVEYLESTGTQFIDTGIEGKDGITAETRIQRTTTSTNECFVGAYNTVNRVWLAYTFSGQWYRGYNVAAGGWTPSTPITDWYTIKSSIPSTGTVVFDCNGTSISSTYITGFSTGVNVQLFQMGNTGTSHYPAKGKMSYCKLYDYGVLIRYFIPALDPNGKPCMWDVVTKQPFYNQGTGEFSYGRSIQQVSYLESTGTQYINTGCILSSTDKGEALAEYTGSPSSGSSYIFGTFGSSKNFGINADLQNSGKFYGVWYNQGTITASTPVPELNKKYKVEVSSNGIYINDTLFSNVSGTFTGSNPAYLFWANGTSQPKSIMKLYWTKFWQNNVLVRDYIPAIDSNNVGFMFDRVTHTIFDNAGTGSFTYGNTVINKLRD